MYALVNKMVLVATLGTYMSLEHYRVLKRVA
jgi:hypothetical protein